LLGNDADSLDQFNRSFNILLKPLDSEDEDAPVGNEEPMQNEVFYSGMPPGDADVQMTQILTKVQSPTQFQYAPSLPPIQLQRAELSNASMMEDG